MTLITPTRRDLLKSLIGGAASLFSLACSPRKDPGIRHKRSLEPAGRIFRSVNGTPQENLIKVIELLGGIEKIIGPNDVVVIKPNAQWWNQGAPNLLSLKTFVELTLERPGGFHGEVILAENCHRGSSSWAATSSAWASNFERNSDVKGIHNLNELVALLKKRYPKKFSACHWIDVAGGGRRIYGPKDGEGYVYCDGTGGVPLLAFDNGVTGTEHRATIMTYPIFSSDRGTVIDFKNGVWEKGTYTGQPLRFINFAALNHHSTYCGATSAIKNYLGVADLSGGPDPRKNGRLTGNYFNFHAFPFNCWAPGPRMGMLGAEVGVFMKSIRKADLNITTAEWVGLSSRVDPPVARTRAILASSDPVALDYHAVRYLLYSNSKVPSHDPQNNQSPFLHCLSECAKQGGGILDEEQISVCSYDLNAGQVQKEEELAIVGEITWGTNPLHLAKLLTLRYLPRKSPF